MMESDDFSTSQKDGYANIVTSADMAVQKHLRSALSQAMPGSGFICEENDIMDAHHEYVWIIDPIDGTANFSRGIDQCAICVGLRHCGEMEMSVVYMPRTRQMFCAEKGKGAWLNGEKIHVSDRPFANGILCTALPVYHKEATPVCSAIITDAFMQCNDIRRFGAAAPELCYLAMGRCELYFEYSLGPWDYAAASLIVREAGGLITDLSGDAPDTNRHSGIVAANSQSSLKRLLSIVKSHYTAPFQ